jgi:hypothetical protein
VLHARPGFAASELGISEATVRQHRSGLYRRTGCVNAAQAAYRLGIAEASASADTSAPAYLQAGKLPRATRSSVRC